MGRNRVTKAGWCGYYRKVLLGAYRIPQYTLLRRNFKSYRSRSGNLNENRTLSLGHARLHCPLVSSSFCHSLPALYRPGFVIAISFSMINSIPMLTQAQQKAPTSTPSTQSNGVIRRVSIIPKAVPVQPTTPTDPDNATWERSPHKAFAKAKADQKPMLLLFTAQWNTICQNLSSEVFSSKTFNRYAKKNLVICYLDFPRNPLDSPDAQRHLKEKFKVHGFPVLLVFDPEGHVIHQVTGYRVGRPVDYFNSLKAITDAQIANLAEQRKRLINQGYREWSNTKGRVFFAQFVSRNETSITLKAPSGEKWKIEINDLSSTDRLFALSFPISSKK